ncbi:MAG: AAA family ATPase [Methanobacteriota archaeon]
MWTLTHEPETLSEFVGNKTVVSNLVSSSWDKPVLITGPIGCGKTLLVKLLAKEKGWDIIFVSEDNIESAKAMAQTTSLFGDKRLIVVDDIDLKKDVKSLVELISESRNPTVAITSDPSSKKLASVKKVCEKIVLRKNQNATVVNFLKLICDREEVFVPPKILEEISENASGDIRSSVNDLQTLCAGRNNVQEKDLELLYARDKKKDVYEFLSKVYGGKPVSELSSESFNLSEQPESILVWIDENLPKLYGSGRNLVDALNYLSRSDIFLGRIRRRQYWGYLRYASPLMSGGVSCSRPEKISYCRYVFPAYYGALGRSKKTREIKKTMGAKASPYLHVSSKIFAQQYVSLYKILLEKKMVGEEEVKSFYKLSDEEIDFLTS